MTNDTASLDLRDLGDLVDVWSRTQNGAKAVAHGVKNKWAVGPEKDNGGNNKNCHYHPANRTPPSYAFYGVPNATC
jgi:hypothetical protein